MELVGGDNIIKSNKLVKVARDQASSKEDQVQIDDMKAICFLISSNPKRYSFLMNKIRD